MSVYDVVYLYEYLRRRLLCYLLLIVADDAMLHHCHASDDVMRYHDVIADDAIGYPYDVTFDFIRFIRCKDDVTENVMR